MKIKFLKTGIVAISLVCFAFTPPDKGKPWAAPDKNAKMSNPVKSAADNLEAGKALYAKHCQSCHGKKGLGDGTKASELKTEPGDFSTSAFQGESDGTLFYKITEGRDDMPSFKKKIADQNEVWSIVNFLRTLKK